QLIPSPLDVSRGLSSIRFLRRCDAEVDSGDVSMVRCCLSQFSRHSLAEQLLRAPFGKCESECCPFSELAFRPDMALVEFHDTFADRETQPRPFLACDGGLAQLLEFIEDPPQIFRGNADA